MKMKSRNVWSSVFDSFFFKHSTMFSRFIEVVACIGISLRMHKNVSIHCCC